MREAERDPARLHHILSSIENVDKFMTDKTLNDLKEDSMLYYAVVKNIEIVGEASYKLTHEFTASHPDTPWRTIIKMRHILVHGYYQVEAEELYNVYKNDLPPLKIQIEAYINEYHKAKST